MATMQEAFGVRNLNRVVETFGDNSPNRFLSSFFAPDPTDGEIYEWDELTFPRDLAPITGPDAPSKNRVELEKTHRTTTLAHMKLNKRINGRKVFLMERGVGALRPEAEATVAREIKDMRNSMEKTIEYLCAKAFKGSIAVSAANIADSDVTFTVTYAVQTMTATTSWATASTKILSAAAELPKIKDDYAKKVGFPVKLAIFNQSVANYLLGNTEIQGWVQNTQRGIEIFDIGHIAHMSDIDWTQYDGNYKPVGGAVTKFIADDDAIFLPEAGNRAEYLRMALGKGMVPQAAIGGEKDMLMSPAPGSGWYSYATVETDPVVLKVILGWVGLPIIVYPDIVLVADTTP